MKTATVFISYSHRDAEFAESLRKHLAPLEREGLIGVWYDGLIAAGSDWNEEIEHRISGADVIIFLVSADFIASEYAYKKELQIALDRRSRGEAIVLPIIVRPVNWEVTPLRKLKVLPTDGIPVVKWEPPDEGWRQVAIATHTAILRQTYFYVEQVDKERLRRISREDPELEVQKFLEDRESCAAKIDEVFADMEEMLETEEFASETHEAMLTKLTEAHEEQFKMKVQELGLVGRIETMNERLVEAGLQDKVVPLSRLGLKESSTQLMRELQEIMGRFHIIMNKMMKKSLEKHEELMTPIRQIR